MCAQCASHPTAQLPVTPPGQITELLAIDTLIKLFRFADVLDAVAETTESERADLGYMIDVALAIDPGIEGADRGVIVFEKTVRDGSIFQVLAFSALAGTIAIGLRETSCFILDFAFNRVGSSRPLMEAFESRVACWLAVAV